MKKKLCLLITSALLLTMTACAPKKETTDHTLKVTGINGSSQKTITVKDRVTGEKVQMIQIKGNEWFMQEPLYVDITFDGNKDIVVPYTRTAAGAYFLGYVWDSTEGRYLQADTLKEIANPALDTEEQVILSRSTASRITTYSVYGFDSKKQDFSLERSLNWGPDESGKSMQVTERTYTAAGKEKETASFLVPASGATDVDKEDTRMAAYYKAGSQWDLDSSKWNETLLPKQPTTLPQQPDTNTSGTVIADRYEVDRQGNIRNFLSTVNVPNKLTEHYEVFTDAVYSAYRYIVTGKNGRVLDTGYTSNGGVYFQESGDLLVMQIINNISDLQVRFFDVETGRTSPLFDSVAAYEDGLVAYFTFNNEGSVILVVQDVFDPSSYYLELNYYFPGQAIHNSNYSGWFEENASKLIILMPDSYTGEQRKVEFALPERNGLSVADQKFMKILANEEWFYSEQGPKDTLSSYCMGTSGDRGSVAEKYTLVDMDSDGTNEMVVHLTGKQEGYLVFYYLEKYDILCCYEFSVRFMTTLKQDGSFVGSSGAGILHFNTLQIYDGLLTGYTVVETAYQNEMEKPAIYRLNGKEVTAESFAQFTQSFDSRADAVWTKIK